MRLHAFLLICLLCSPLAFSLNPFTVEENVQMERVGGPWLSSDGRNAIFSARKWTHGNSFTIKLYRMDIEKSDSESLLVDCPEGQPCICSDVQFLTDSVIVFLKNGVLTAMDIHLKWDKTIHEFPVPVSNLRLESGLLAWTAEVYPGKSMDETARIDRHKSQQINTGRTYDQLMIRRWASWFEGKFSHVFVAQFSSWQLYNIRDVMLDQHGDCPGKPFGGAEEYAIQRYGDYIAYTMQVKEHSKEAYQTNHNIYLYEMRSGETQCITCGHEAKDSTPVWHPSGNQFVYLAQEEPGYESDRARVKLYDVDARRITVLSEEFDRSVDAVSWLTNDVLLIKAMDNARAKLFKLHVSTRRVEPVTQEHSVGAFVSHNGETVLMGVSAYTFPTELFTLSLQNGTMTQITHRNTRRLSQCALSEPIDLHFTGANHDTIQAYFFKPANYQPYRKYPLVLYVHGGPESPWMDSWSYRWNPQTITAQGFALLAVNFHGSMSFGSEFTRSIRERWGTWPFEDHLRGLEHVFDKYGDMLDRDRIVGMGASYGGYMMNWLNGHTDFFKALVCHDGIFDMRSFYYNTEELYFPESEFHGPAYKNQSLYERFNPANYVQYWKTPTLVIHSGCDYRIPETHGIGAFTALQRRGIPSRLLYFPDENHFVLKYQNTIQWHHEVIDWLKKWTQ